MKKNESGEGKAWAEKRRGEEEDMKTGWSENVEAKGHRDRGRRTGRPRWRWRKLKTAGSSRTGEAIQGTKGSGEETTGRGDGELKEEGETGQTGGPGVGGESRRSRKRGHEAGERDVSVARVRFLFVCRVEVGCPPGGTRPQCWAASPAAPPAADAGQAAFLWRSGEKEPLVCAAGGTRSPTDTKCSARGSCWKGNCVCSGSV